MTEKTHASIDELSTWVEAYRQATANAKQWQDVADRAKEHITAALDAAEADVGTVNGQQAVRYTVVNGSRLDTKKLRANHPDLADEFTVPTVTRRFTLVDPKRETTDG